MKLLTQASKTFQFDMFSSYMAELLVARHKLNLFYISNAQKS